MERAIEKAEQTEVPIDIRPARAESLPYEDEIFETIIAFSVFCTIGDVEQALNEVHRVLQPNGELRFYEHVHSDGLPGRVQNLLTPVWKRAVAGCHLNRKTEKVLRESALDIVEITTADRSFRQHQLFVGWPVENDVPLECNPVSYIICPPSSTQYYDRSRTLSLSFQPFRYGYYRRRAGRSRYGLLPRPTGVRVHYSGCQ